MFKQIHLRESKDVFRPPRCLTVSAPPFGAPIETKLIKVPRPRETKVWTEVLAAMVDVVVVQLKG